MTAKFPVRKRTMTTGVPVFETVAGVSSEKKNNDYWSTGI